MHWKWGLRVRSEALFVTIDRFPCEKIGTDALFPVRY